mgnify:CR=1 FL=1|tara:strand:- start:2743 stop:3921 length:1179 start_codon:yes stop_codon:yes gene_type:complete
MFAEKFIQSKILTDARAIDGLDDFGEPDFYPALEVLLSDLAAAPLNKLGASILRGGIVRSLANRLRLNYWFVRYPEIANENIIAPLVVVGMMRSGTTLIQRLLASDPHHCTTLGWEALEPAPALSYDPAQAELTDPRITNAEMREANSRKYTPHLFSIHPSYALKGEEEIMFLADAFLSHVHESSCHLPVYRKWLDQQDFTPAYHHLHRCLQILQWQKKHRGESCHRWVLKTPAHLGYLDTLLTTFSDAHIVHMHRDPIATIPSGASLNATLWQMHSDQVDPLMVGRQWIERMQWTNHRALAVRSKMKDEDQRFTDVYFRDVVSDPIAQAEKIYGAIGQPLSDQARAAMVDWLAEDSKDKLPKHRYDAEKFGLSEKLITEQFSDYIRRFHQH